MGLGLAESALRRTGGYGRCCGRVSSEGVSWDVLGVSWPGCVDGSVARGHAWARVVRRDWVGGALGLGLNACITAVQWINAQCIARGRLDIAARVAWSRVVSTVDPDMRWCGSRRDRGSRLDALPRADYWNGA